MRVLVQEVRVETRAGHLARQIRCWKIEDLTTAGADNDSVACFAFQYPADRSASQYDAKCQIDLFAHALQTETMTACECEAWRQMIVLASESTGIVWAGVVCVIRG